MAIILGSAYFVAQATTIGEQSDTGCASVSVNNNKCTCVNDSSGAKPAVVDTTGSEAGDGDSSGSVAQ